MSFALLSNGTPNGNYTFPFSDFREFLEVCQTIRDVKTMTCTATIVLGTPLNLWLLIAILTATHIRSQMRTQLVCAVLVCNSAKAAVGFSLQLAIHTNEIKNCILYSFYSFIYIPTSWLVVWYTLIWLSFYIASLMRIDTLVCQKFSSSSLRIGRFFVLIGPVVISLAVVTSVYAYYFYKQPDYALNGCIVSTPQPYAVFSDVIILSPFVFMLAAIPTMLSLVGWRKLQIRNEAISSLLTELTECNTVEVETPTNAKEDETPPAPIEKLTAYLAVCALFVVTRLPYVIYEAFDLGVRITDSVVLVKYVFAMNYFHEAEVLMLPFCFMLLPEVRNRIKEWGPWKQSSWKSIAVTVRYRK